MDLLIDDKLVVGSCNWTVSSSANSEVGVLVHMHPSRLRLVKDVLESRLAGGELLEVALKKPRRSRSVSRHDRETDD